jgi:hypothetical protein
VFIYDSQKGKFFKKILAKQIVITNSYNHVLAANPKNLWQVQKQQTE